MGTVLQQYRPLVTVQINTTIVRRFATKEYVDISGYHYLGTLLEAPTVRKELPDIFYGIEQSSNVTLRFSNLTVPGADSWETIIAAQEIRGAGVTINWYDPGDAAAIFVYRGKVSSYTVGNVTTVTVASREDEILDTLLPTGVVTVEIFGRPAQDVGKPINICWGYCRDVPLWNVNNDLTLNQYDYLIGYGTINSIWSDPANGRGVKRNGILVKPEEYTFYDGSAGSPYLGYACIRFIKEQRDFNGRFYDLTADIQGIEDAGAMERNPATIIYNLLTNTSYGLGDSANWSDVGDTYTFEAAETALNAIGNMYCDGAITSQQQARDIINDILFQCRSHIWRASDGKWEIRVDQKDAGAVGSFPHFGDNDGHWNNAEIQNISAMESEQCIKTVEVHYAHSQWSTDQYYKKYLTVRSTFGVAKVYDLPFVYEHDAAKNVLNYVKFRQKWSDKFLSIRVGMEGRDRNVGDVICVHAPTRGITSALYKIQTIEKSLTKFAFGCRQYSTAIYNTTNISSPSSYNLSTASGYGPQFDATPWIASSSSFTALPNCRYRINIASTFIKMTLPSTPAVNDLVMWIDNKRTFASTLGDYFMIMRNGKNIEGYADNMACINPGEGGTLIYTGLTYGWKLL